MSSFNNRHIVTALLVAPLLAVVAWYLVGQLASNPASQPAPAQEGASYPMVERPGCRYSGGACGLSNGDFKIAIDISARGLLRMRSAVPLDYVLVGLTSSADREPVRAAPVGAQRDQWIHDFAVPVASESALRVVAGVGGVAWFGEASLQFTAPAD